jgi:probable rRNA maturation factor
MPVLVGIRNESIRKRLYRRAGLLALAERICKGEGLTGTVEVSLLFCDDDFITDLNRRYRRKNSPTDVLSFEQSPSAGMGPRVLGDIVISLETAERNCGGDRALMRDEVNLLFCHGLLHLLGHDHGTAFEKQRMTERQARYLGTSHDAAWHFGPKRKADEGSRSRMHTGGRRGR